MFDAQNDTHDLFRTYLVTVVGQAFDAAGYTLVHAPLKWAGGQFRFVRDFGDADTGTIEFQLLRYTENAFSGGAPSRFRVTLHRSGDSPRSRDLSALVVQDFGVAILPSAAHWWSFRDADELAHALAEAGHLIVGYGLPWLSGDLTPGANNAAPPAEG